MLVTDGLPKPRKYWALSAVLTSMAMTVLESSVTNIALPSITGQLGILPAQAVWIVNAYQLAIVVALLPLASLAEIYGYKRIFLCGLGVFVAASAGCGLATSFSMLVGFRLLQGLGAAAVMSVVPALLRFIYSQKQYGRALGLNAMIAAVSSAVGPMVGSVILSVTSWPWLFAINVPIGAVAFIIGVRMLPAPERAKRRFDWVSAMMSGTLFGLLIIGLDHLLTDVRIAAICLPIAAIAAYLLVRRELTHPAPLLPLDLLRIRLFRYSIVASVCAFAAQTMAFVALPFFFQNILGRDQLQMGMLMVPWPIGVLFAAPVSARLAERFPPSLLSAIGTGANALGLCLIVLLPTDISNTTVMACMLLCGVGFGTYQTPNNRVMLTSAPRSRSGGAGGMQATARQFGMALGATVVGLAFTAMPSHGSTTALLVGSLFLVISGTAGLIRGGSKLQHGAAQQ